MSAQAIYGLAHRGEIRYVGKTTQSLQHRLNGHLSRARAARPGTRYVYDWLRSVDFAIELVVLERDPPGGLDEAERAWIATLRRYGCRLTNLTEGGEGGAGRIPGPKTRAKMSAARRGQKLSPEHAQAIRRGQRGRSNPWTKTETFRETARAAASRRKRDELGRFT